MLLYSWYVCMHVIYVCTVNHSQTIIMIIVSQYYNTYTHQLSVTLDIHSSYIWCSTKWLYSTSGYNDSPEHSGAQLSCPNDTMSLWPPAVGLPS